MKKLSPLFAACLLGFCAVASANTYECTDRQGRRTYTASPGPNCRAVNLGRMTTYPAPVSTAPSYPSYSSPATPEPAAPAAQPAVSEASASIFSIGTQSVCSAPRPVTRMRKANTAAAIFGAVPTSAVTAVLEP